MQQPTHEDVCQDDRGPCDCLPQPVRTNFFHGQLINERDLQTEQAYFRDKLRHAHRCLHGYGVICGMEVHPVAPPEECIPDDIKKRKVLRNKIAQLQAECNELREIAKLAEDDEEIRKRQETVSSYQEELITELDLLNRVRQDQTDDPCQEEKSLHLVRVTCGAAIDCNGNDVILRHDRPVDVLELLKPSEKVKLMYGCSHTIYLSICYEECGHQPTRPFAMDACATTRACEMARVAEGARIIASLSKPEEDGRCDPCCTCCTEPCILLATVEVAKGEPIEAADINHSVRRRFGLYDPTVITGISWAHGATYSVQSANEILGTRNEKGGIEISFSRSVYSNTITRGTVEVMRITRGGGLAGVILEMDGKLEMAPDEKGMVDRIRYRNVTRESVQPEDRIMIVVRTPFLLDRCCRPVEGLHVGGRVPQLTPQRVVVDQGALPKEPKAKHPHNQTCPYPPHGLMPWTTSGPGNFESWFWVGEE